MVLAILISPEMSRALPFWRYFVEALWWSAAAMATLVYIRIGAGFIEQYEMNNHD